MNPLDNFSRTTPTPKIDKEGKYVGLNGSYGFKWVYPSEILSRKINPPKKIQNTAPQEKYEESLVPQVSHILEVVDPS